MSNLKENCYSLLNLSVIELNFEISLQLKYLKLETSYHDQKSVNMIKS
jgi:hypothetical protein